MNKAMSDAEKARKEQYKKGEKMVKSAKNWSDYWKGIDYIICSLGFDTDKEYDELEEKLDKKYGHTLS